VVAAVLHLQGIHTLADNGKAVLLEGERDGRRLGVLAVYKGPSDLQLLYPLDAALKTRVAACLEGKKTEGPIIDNRVEGDTQQPVLSDWNEKLFELDVIVNKDM